MEGGSNTDTLLPKENGAEGGEEESFHDVSNYELIQWGICMSQGVIFYGVGFFLFNQRTAEWEACEKTECYYTNVSSNIAERVGSNATFAATGVFIFCDELTNIIMK